jgi:hypothetical protein
VNQAGGALDRKGIVSIIIEAVSLLTNPEKHSSGGEKRHGEEASAGPAAIPGLSGETHRLLK